MPLVTKPAISCNSESCAKAHPSLIVAQCAVVLHKLAVELAKRSKTKELNLDVVHTEVVLKNFRDLLKEKTAEEVIKIVAALLKK